MWKSYFRKKLGIWKHDQTHDEYHVMGIAWRRKKVANEMKLDISITLWASVLAFTVHLVLSVVLKNSCIAFTIVRCSLMISNTIFCRLFSSRGEKAAEPWRLHSGDRVSQGRGQGHSDVRDKDWQRHWAGAHHPWRTSGLVIMSPIAKKHSTEEHALSEMTVIDRKVSLTDSIQS